MIPAVLMAVEENGGRDRLCTRRLSQLDPIYVPNNAYLYLRVKINQI